jgi:hypothetical protein
LKGMFRGHKQGGVAVPWDRREIIREGVAAVLERCDKNHQGISCAGSLGRNLKLVRGEPSSWRQCRRSGRMGNLATCLSS